MDSINRNSGSKRANTHIAFAFVMGAMVLGFVAPPFAVAQSGSQSAPKAAPKAPGSELLPASARHAAPDFSLSDLGGSH